MIEQAWIPEIDGEELREQRRRIGINQKEGAQLLGVNLLMLSGWERGIHTPRFPVIVRLAMEALSRRKSRGTLVRPTYDETVEPPSAPEQWATIPEWPEYEASTHGRIRRVQPGIGVPLARGGLLRGWTSPNGRRNVKLCRDGVCVSLGFARLILLAFSRLPEDDEEADHVNAVGTDNSLANLRWLDKDTNFRLGQQRMHVRRGQHDGRRLLDLIGLESARVSESATVDTHDGN